MQIPSYRRLLVTAATAVAFFAIPASASAASSSYPVSSGSSSYYSNGQTVGGNYYSDGSMVDSSATSSFGSGYGSISTETGRPRTEAVSGYVNSYGSYTDPYYRS